MGSPLPDPAGILRDRTAARAMRCSPLERQRDRRRRALSMPLHLQPASRPTSTTSGGDLPVTETVADTCLSLPEMTDEQQGTLSTRSDRSWISEMDVTAQGAKPRAETGPTPGSPPIEG